MKYYAINGSPFANKITGIERYMYETLRRVDKIINTECAEIYLLCPENVKLTMPDFTNIKIIYLRHKRGKVKISEIHKFLKTKNAVYCTMSGNLCIQKGAVVCTHDIRPWIYKQYDPFMFRVKCRLNFLSSKFFSGKMVTVSETSKKEISRYLSVKPEKIEVIPNGWEHMEEIAEDMTFWDRHPEIRKGEYYYSLSSQAPHKNFKWIVENAKRHPENTYIVAGKVWDIMKNDSARGRNIVYLGYVSDGESKTLMKNCKGFIHPSKYEGFGITPLEALSCGATLYVSKASCLPEIFNGVASFFDPDDYDFSFESNSTITKEEREKTLVKYSWDRAAEKWCFLFEGGVNG